MRRTLAATDLPLSLFMALVCAFRDNRFRRCRRRTDARRGATTAIAAAAATVPVAASTASTAAATVRAAAATPPLRRLAQANAICPTRPKLVVGLDLLITA